MNRQLLLRLTLDFIATALFILALAFEWFGSFVHEIIGTVFFGLLVAHITFNRRWFASLSKATQNRRRFISTVVNLSLAVAGSALLITSLMISRDLFWFLGLSGDFFARQIHTLCAYWVLVIIGVHLGLHWVMIMGFARSLFGISTHNGARALLLRAFTILVAMYGVFASLEMNIGSKLALIFTFSYWDFDANWLRFLVNYGTIITLYAAMGHYGNKTFIGNKSRKQTRRNEPRRISGGTSSCMD
ncbi:DUF4405 domain-containing protein [uncultured Cohaesibacter sp.]|uniref:DUF4405 domain-containing protein n=1 Tax=uncultured Cohaesibacter sp. TaxID=1002546 RepID=UPI0029C6B737|nr:DUF4405 domain-containing protein [uncultured Cohaesibacter sp.]